MIKAKDSTEARERDDDTGVFHKLIDDAENANRIANRALRAAMKTRGGDKRVLIIARDYERAANLRRLLAEREVGDSIAIASSASSAYEMIRERSPMMVVVEPELADLCAPMLASGTQLYVLNGDDVETAAQIKREDP